VPLDPDTFSSYGPRHSRTAGYVAFALTWPLMYPMIEEQLNVAGERLVDSWTLNTHRRDALQRDVGLIQSELKRLDLRIVGSNDHMSFALSRVDANA
jgi:hypothetical protein